MNNSIFKMLLIAILLGITPDPSYGQETQAENAPAPESATSEAVPSGAPSLNAPVSGQPERWFANIGLVMGSTFMVDSSWKDDEKDILTAGGLEADFGKYTWPVNIYLGAHSASPSDQGDSFDEGFSIGTMMIGPRYYHEKKGNIRPYATAGLALLSSRRDSLYKNEREITSSANGLFLNAGVFFKMGYFQMGLDATAVIAGALEDKQSAHYVRIGLVLGFGTK